MAQIFVSYSRTDQQFVDDFVPLLRKVYGLDNVWYDVQIPGGHNWWQLILRQIQQSELFIYLLSNEALASQYCHAEFREAKRLQKLILPVIIRPKTQISESVPEDIRQLLEQTQWIDLSQGFKNPDADAALYGAINRLLFENSPRSAPVSSTSEAVSKQRVIKKYPPYLSKILVLVGVAGIVFLYLVVSNRIPRQQDFKGVPMMLVPAGCFIMGIDNEPDSQSKTCLGAFWIDRDEVTNVQFDHFKGAAAKSGDWPDPQQPRTSVSWLEAYDFCAKRGARLPTEKEWEYAARGPDSLRYPWGNEWKPDNVVYGENSKGRPAQVGSRPVGASWVGALDMLGNVWEFTNTRDDGVEAYDPVSNRIRRGGSFDDIPTELLNSIATSRITGPPDATEHWSGFRCALSS